MKYKKWHIILKNPQDPVLSIVKLRQKELGIEVDSTYDKLSSPQLIPGIKKATHIIREAIKNKLQIGLFMDYDADGVCSGAIIYKTIKYLGGKCDYYVPERSEGYGLSNKAVDYFVEKKVPIIITLDCGINNFDQIEYANKKGIKIIVVDHHLFGKKLPAAEAIIHPGLGKKKNNLSGAGVAFQLARQLVDDSPQAKWLLDLAAISTVADVVPLIGDNRIIVKYGLMVISKTKNIGLRCLLKEASLNSANIDSYEIGYVIAPRLNAAGRIAKPIDSFRLLITSDWEKAKELASRLSRFNAVRQQQLTKSIEVVKKTILKKKLYKEKIIVLLGDWSEGIVGLIAGKITDEFYRPAIVLTKTDSKIKGSARSIPGIDVTELIGRFKELLLSYGGHKQAAGLSLGAGNFSQFKQGIIQEAKQIDDKMFDRQLKIDALVSLEKINIEMIEGLDKLKPFGMGNPRPILAVEKVFVKDLQQVGKQGDHLKMKICSKDGFCKAIFFNYNNNGCRMREGAYYDFAFSLMVDEWNGRKNICLNIIDGKKSV